MGEGLLYCDKFQKWGNLISSLRPLYALNDLHLAYSVRNRPVKNTEFRSLCIVAYDIKKLYLMLTPTVVHNDVTEFHNDTEIIKKKTIKCGVVLINTSMIPLHINIFKIYLCELE